MSHNPAGEGRGRGLNDCPRAGKWFRGCRFEPRYDLGNPAPYEFKSGSSSAVVDVLEATKPKTYVRDVCRTCGHTIERFAGRQALAAVEEKP